MSNYTLSIKKLSNLYPVGSIYLSVNDTDPSTLFGGTWEQIKDRFLLAAGDTYAAGATGGEATHKLTVAEMPSHSHSYTKPNVWSINPGGYDATSVCTSRSDTTTSATGGDQPHNNMPPYLAIYMWQRIS